MITGFINTSAVLWAIRVLNGVGASVFSWFLGSSGLLEITHWDQAHIQKADEELEEAAGNNCGA